MSTFSVLLQALLRFFLDRLFRQLKLSERFLQTPKSVKRTLVYGELKKAFIAGLGGATLFGGLTLGLQTLAASAPTLFVNPYVGSLVGFILLQLATVVALYETGENRPPGPPSPEPAPSPVPNPAPAPQRPGLFARLFRRRPTPLNLADLEAVARETGTEVWTRTPPPLFDPSI